MSLVKDNAFFDSAPMRVKETVGDPITRISSNRFERTSAPDISMTANARGMKP
jgi:hypothetical protein